MVSSNSLCPYVGLQPYTEAERDYFFGRDRDQRIISSNLYAATLTILYGASGVGKSSVLLAGVVPRLRAIPRTAVVVFRAWQDPTFLHALKLECIKAVEEAQNESLSVDTALPLDDLLLAAQQALGGPIFIVLDQFEEYFLYHPESQTDSPFDVEFARAVNREDIRASFLIALREDGLSKLDRFRSRIPNLLANRLRLEHLDPTAAEESIRKPLDVYNARVPGLRAPVTIEDELVHAVLSQVQTGQVLLGQSAGVGQAQPSDESAGSETARVEAPFLQLVMTRLWNEEMQVNSRALRHSTLERLGGAERIVRTHLDGLMDKLGSTEQEVCARFFDRLVTPSGTKIAYPVRDLTSFAADLAPHVTPILKTLSDARILRSVDAPPDPMAQRYEIFHDVLAPAILAWLAQRQAEEKRRRSEDRARADERAKGARLRLWMITGLAVLGLVAAGSAMRVRSLRRQAAERFRADSLALAANETRIRADSLAHAAEDAQFRTQTESARRVSAEKASRIATSLRLAAEAFYSLGSNPDLAALLALQAVSETYSADRTVLPEAVNALRRAAHQARRIILTVPGDTSPVVDVGFTPDGKQLSILGVDGTVKVWDVALRRVLTILYAYADETDRVALSPDGRRLATAGSDYTAKVWDVASGTALLTLSGHRSRVTGITYSRDGTRLATVSGGTASVWDASSGRRLSGMTQQGTGVNRAGAPITLRITAVALSPDGTRLVTASYDGMARVWSATSGQLLDTLSGHLSEIRGVAFSPDGALLATASADNTAKVWDVDSGRALVTLSGHREDVVDVAFSLNGKQLATASADSTVRVWDASSGQALLTLSGEVNSVAFSGQILATVGQDGSIRLWDVTVGQRRPVDLRRSQVARLAMSGDGTRLVTVGHDGVRQLWDVVSGQMLDTLPDSGRVSGIALSFDGKRLATATDDYDSVTVWDLESSQADRSLSIGLSSSSRSRSSGSVDRVLALTTDGARLVTASDDTLKVWDTKSDQLWRTFIGRPVSGAAFSRNGTRLATASNDGTARVWNVGTGQLVDILSGYEVTGVALAPDGRRVATVSSDGTVSVWNVAQPRSPDTLFSVRQRLRSLAFSHDGKRLTVIAADGTMQDYVVMIEDLIEEVRQRAARPLTPKECHDYYLDLKGMECRAADLIADGRTLARRGDVSGAVAKFRRAQELKRNLSLDPELEARRLAAEWFVAKGFELATSGVIGTADGALAAFASAETLDRSLKISPAHWNHVCWCGALHRRAFDALTSCERAVALDSANWHFRDSRGLARALTGDTTGAIQDFRAFIDATDNRQLKTQRQRWIGALGRGEDPFTSDEIKLLFRVSACQSTRRSLPGSVRP